MDRNEILTYQRDLNIIKEIVLDIRKELSTKYDVESEEYKDFAGLCFTGSSMCCERIAEKLFPIYGKIQIDQIHGEQRYHPRIYSGNWAIQHDWVKVNLPSYTMYVDSTSSQFKHLYDDIPDYYISNEKPKWYYPDRENPAWNGWTCWINKYCKIKRSIVHDGEKFTAHEGIIQAIQYSIWGSISNLIRKVIYHE